MNIGILMLILFAASLAIGIPIAFSLGIAVFVSIVFFNTMGMDMFVMTLVTSCDSFPYLAIPLFILAGEIMLTGGLSKRLIDCSAAMVGNRVGSLGIITVIACMIFAAISGSGPATTAAIGGIMIPAMMKENYDSGYACSLTAASGAMGPIIPPSISFILYGVMAEQSITKLFIAGIVPGILMAAVLSGFVYVTSKKYKYGVLKPKATMKEKLTAMKNGIFALLIPVIILGGIYGGIFTPTEAAVVACDYGLIVGFFIYKDLKFKDLVGIFTRTATTSGYCLVLIGTAVAFGKVLTLEGIPRQLANFIYDLSSNPIIILLAINILLLLFGCVLEIISGILILGPLLLAIIVPLGIDPVHFGVIMVMNLVIGMCTPPVGVNMFVASGIGGIPIEKMFKWLFAYIALMITTLLIVTYIPALSLFLPSLISQ